MLKLLKVSGSSLLPAHQDGDFVLVSKIPYLFGPIRPGDVIVFRHKTYGTMIKRVASVAPNQDEIHVVGTQNHSVDSREFGAISKEAVVGKVIGAIRRPSKGGKHHG
jgi:signal peptidase I